MGSNYFDYRLIEKGDPQNDNLFGWREAFFDTCNQFNVKPADACVQFALNVPGVKSIALNTTNASRVKSNLEMVDTDIPIQFWQQLKSKDLIETDFIFGRQ